MAEFKLVQTCGACPEQYDVFRGDEQVAYLRLRHGTFRVECPPGNTIFTAEPEGDGMFACHERDHYLRTACEAIKARLDNPESNEIYEIVNHIEVE